MKISQLNALALALLACVSLAACSPAKQEKTEAPAPAATQEQTQQDQQPKSDELFGEDKQEADQAQPAPAEPAEGEPATPAQEGEAPADANTPAQEQPAPSESEQAAQPAQSEPMPAEQAQQETAPEASEPAPQAMLETTPVSVELTGLSTDLTLPADYNVGNLQGPAPEETPASEVAPQEEAAPQTPTPETAQADAATTQAPAEPATPTEPATPSAEDTQPAPATEGDAVAPAQEPAPTPVEVGPAVPAQGEGVPPTDSYPAGQPAVMETPAYPVVAVNYRIIHQSIQCKEADRNLCEREEIIAAVTNIPAINEYFEKWFPEASKRSVSNEVKLVADVKPSDSLTRVFFVGQNQNLATFVVKKFVNPTLTEDYVVFDLNTNKPLEIASLVGSDAEFNYVGLNTDLTLSVHGKRFLPEYLASASDAGKNSSSIQNHATDLLYNVLEAKYRDYLVETYGSKYNVADLDQLIELRSQEGFTLYFSDNFNFTADGVKFFYNNGVLDTDPNTSVPMNVELLVPYYELKGIFKPQYLLGYNLDHESLFNF